MSVQERFRTAEMENPGALAGATGAEFEAAGFKSEAYKLRAKWAMAAWQALERCNPEDAAQLCAGYLEGLGTGGPILGSLLGTTAGEAKIWADSAPVNELAAYVAAGLDRLRGLALARNARKRLFWAIWKSFGSEDRRAFLAQVNGRGRA